MKKDLTTQGNYVLWRGYPDIEGYGEIFIYNLNSGETIQITANEISDCCPAIYGDYVTWIRSFDDDSEVLMTDLSNC